MRYLLDTNALLFYLYNHEQLSPSSLKIVHDEQKLIYVNIVSLWEIAIKASIGKLKINKTICEIDDICREVGFNLLSITPKHLDWITSLPQIHGDPFDRLIISQALTENLTIITKDTIIPTYDVNTLW